MQKDVLACRADEATIPRHVARQRPDLLPSRLELRPRLAGSRNRHQLRRTLVELPRPRPIQRQILVPMKLVADRQSRDHTIARPVIRRQNLHATSVLPPDDPAIALIRPEHLPQPRSSPHEPVSLTKQNLSLVTRRSSNRNPRILRELAVVQSQPRHQRRLAIALRNHKPALRNTREQILHERNLERLRPPTLARIKNEVASPLHEMLNRERRQHGSPCCNAWPARELHDRCAARMFARTSAPPRDLGTT